MLAEKSLSRQSYQEILNHYEEKWKALPTPKPTFKDYLAKQTRNLGTYEQYRAAAIDTLWFNFKVEAFKAYQNFEVKYKKFVPDGFQLPKLRIGNVEFIPGVKFGGYGVGNVLDVM